MYVYGGFPTSRRNGWRTCRSLHICSWFALAHGRLTSDMVRLYHSTECSCFLATNKGTNHLYDNIVDRMKVIFHQCYFRSGDNVIIEARRAHRCPPSLNVSGRGVILYTSIPTSVIWSTQQSLQSTTVMLCSLVILITYTWETILISFNKQLSSSS